MGNFPKAIEYLLGNETFVGKGGVVVSHYEDPATGEISSWGISLRWLLTIDPSATADTIRKLTKDAAIALYHQHWWLRYKLDFVPSDRCAIKLFDSMVNMGPQTAVRIFQETLNEPLSEEQTGIVEDGFIGSQVAQAVTHDMIQPNGEDQLLAAFAENLATHYEDIVTKNTAQQKNLEEWLKRAEKLPV